MNMKHSCFVTNGPLISVIIPVYNTERYLAKCLNSILNQSYQNLEVIVVDDGSTDKSIDIAKTFMDRDERITIITHKGNKGLFQARLTGVTASHGNFVAFVDADDSISLDWFRLLLHEAINNDCDIVAGQFCFDFGNGNYQTLSLDPMYIKKYNLKGSSVFDEFLAQSYSCFSFHVVWNKLYKKELWDKALDDLSSFSLEHGHMLMWEDLVFSSAIWSLATHFSNISNCYYFYNKENNQASTQVASFSKEKISKYIIDASGAIKFLLHRIKNINRSYAEIEYMVSKWNQWNTFAVWTVYKDIISNGENQWVLKELEKAFNIPFNDILRYNELDDFFYSLYTPLSPVFLWEEDCKRAIISSDTFYVSFDVFDTLVKRTVLDPKDIFSLLSFSFNSKFKTNQIDISKLRITAEEEARKKNSCIQKEEISLDDIYSWIISNTVLDASQVLWLKQKEIALERQYCQRKETGWDLYNLAIDSGKKVITCSDMYLPEEVVKEILKNSGYTKINQYFVSSTFSITKASGQLYKKVISSLDIAPNHIVHVGDNWDSDFIKAQENGIKAFHFSKAKDFLFNANPGVFTGQGITNVLNRNIMGIDMRVVNQFLSIRNALGLMATKNFDNFTCNANAASEYNASPSRIGYQLLGPHLLAVCNWIAQISEREKIPTIHFVARDGYLVKRAFEIFDSGKKYSSTNYLRLSRRSLLLCGIKSKSDFYSLAENINVWSCSAKKLFDYLSYIIPESKHAEVESRFNYYGINWEQEFRGLALFYRTMKCYIDDFIEMSLLESYQKQLARYFKDIVQPGDYIFDIGYSGRPENALSYLLGYPVGSLYIHTNNELAKQRHYADNCKSFVFYNHKPIITGFLREHLFMEMGPSTIGYNIEGDNVTPLLDTYSCSYSSRLITSVIQESALSFVSDYCKSYSEYFPNLDIRNDDFSSFYECFQHFPTDFDLSLFKCVPFEDSLGAGDKLNLADMWSNDIQNGCPIVPLQSKSSVIIEPNTASGVIPEGLIVTNKLVSFADRFLPKGSRRRNVIKKVIGKIL